MTAPGSVDSSAALPCPELDRRARRRQGWVLLLLAGGAFVLAAACIAGLGPASELPEGMLWLSLALCAAMLLLAGSGLLLVGVLRLVRPIRVGPAWLVDPRDPSLARWWDGQQWTDRTSPRSAQTVALAALSSSSTRRHRLGAGLLVGGLLVAVGSQWLASAMVVPVTDPARPTNNLWILVGQLSLPAAGLALLGLYLLLTLTSDVPPGWQPDPLDAEQLRWWDGNDWSEATVSRTGPEAAPHRP